MRSTILMTVTLLTAALTSCVPANLQTTSLAGTTTTFILIRHAERDDGADPPLNAEGQQRAQTLKDVLAENGVTAIYCTDLIRNRQTVQTAGRRTGAVAESGQPAALREHDTDGGGTGRRNPREPRRRDDPVLWEPRLGLRLAGHHRGDLPSAGRHGRPTGSLPGHVHRRGAGRGGGAVYQAGVRRAEQPGLGAAPRSCALCAFAVGPQPAALAQLPR